MAPTSLSAEREPSAACGRRPSGRGGPASRRCSGPPRRSARPGSATSSARGSAAGDPTRASRPRGSRGGARPGYGSGPRRGRRAARRPPRWPAAAGGWSSGPPGSPGPRYGAEQGHPERMQRASTRPGPGPRARAAATATQRPGRQQQRAAARRPRQSHRTHSVSNCQGRPSEGGGERAPRLPERTPTSPPSILAAAVRGQRACPPWPG